MEGVRTIIRPHKGTIRSCAQPNLRASKPDSFLRTRAYPQDPDPDWTIAICTFSRLVTALIEPHQDFRKGDSCDVNQSSPKPEGHEPST